MVALSKVKHPCCASIRKIPSRLFTAKNYIQIGWVPLEPNLLELGHIGVKIRSTISDCPASAPVESGRIGMDITK
jgi:hypothetical protein